jgi:GTPase involved in cell partitioning and DNA repair
MHLKDISLRMDEKDPKHAQLRSFIKTYLGSVEKLEKELVDIELGRKEENKSEIAQLERKVEILNKDVDNLTAKLIQNKLDLITAKEKKNELNKTFLRYMSSIYNPVVESINKTITTSSRINRTLKNYD